MSIRKHYDEDLHELDSVVAKMGRAAVDAVERAVTALEAGNKAAARTIVESDGTIDAMERDIEHRCMELFLRQQPVAGDLRRVSTALKLVTDIERIGDHAADISEIVPYLDPDTACCRNTIPALVEMTRAAKEMDSDAIEAFTLGDATRAQSVIERDDRVDAQFDVLKRSLARAIAEEPACIDEALDLLMVAKYAERLGDHAVNIAEWVIFLKTGVYRGEQIV